MFIKMFHIKEYSQFHIKEYSQSTNGCCLFLARDFNSTVLKGPRIISLMHRFSFHMDPVLDKFYCRMFFCVCDVFMFHTMACDDYSSCSLNA
jgi:hypothetical protein